MDGITIESKRRSLIERYASPILIAFAIATPLLMYASLRSIQTKTNKVADWLPATYTETDDLIWFREHFVGDQFVIVSWEGCRLGDDPSQANAEPDDPRIEQLAQLLVPAVSNPEDSDVNSPEREESKAMAFDSGDPSVEHFFKSVTTSRRLLNQLTSGSMNIPYDLAVNRLKGLLIGPDGHQTCVVVMLADESIPRLRDAIGRGTNGWFQISHPEGELFTALRACNIDLDTVHLGGPAVDNVAIDEEGERTLLRLASLAALIGLLLAWWSLRSIRLTLIVFACGLLSALASLAMVWITGETTDAFLLSMPSLVYVLAISGAVHLIKYYRDAVDEQGLVGAPEKAIFHGWKPTLLCSVTTAFGLMALYTSDLTPVRKFGTYSSIGVMMMLVVLFVFLPAALQHWPIRSGTRKILDSNPDGRPNFERSWDFLQVFWQKFGGWVIRRYVWVTAACIVLIVVVGFGVTRVRTNIDLMKLFDGDARILQDYRWLESNVGRLVPMEIVLRFDQDSLRRDDDTPLDKRRYSFLDRIETVAAVQRVIALKFGSRGEDVIGQSISAITFVPPLPKKRTDAVSYARRSLTNTKLKKSYDSLSNSGYLTTDSKDGAELWRISVRVAAFKDVDYGAFTDELRKIVDPIVDHHNRVLKKRIYPDSETNSLAENERQVVSAVYTGVIPIVYKAQRALLDSLIESTFWSFITITPLLMIVSRGVLAGAVAMLPNTLPVLVVFGGMGWLGFPVAIGSMMSASIALGVAVDDTIHYLMWFREELNHTDDRRQANLAAYRRCATPTLQAALISGLGLSVFAFSTFTPTKQFGFLMLTILLTGVVAELVLLPALLTGPLGKSFLPNRRTRAKTAAEKKAARCRAVG